jgi:phage terminase large subunit
MMIHFKNGSTWQLMGSDKFDALVGAPPAGIVFSEYALSNPSSWAYLRPMLLENGGWAIFNSTVRGSNHFYKLGEFSRHDPGWFFQQLDADKSGVFTPEQLASELLELQAEHGEEWGRAIWLQEYFNDPSAPVRGAYFAAQMVQADKAERITRVPWDPALLVHTSWDLGINNRTVVWFWQTVGAEIRAINCRAYMGTGLPEIIADLRTLGYNFGQHYAPHDSKVRELGSGKSRKEIAQGLGMTWNIVPQVGLLSGIDQVRVMLPRVWFDADACRDGIEALRLYRTEYDDERKVYSPSPLHDWTSDYADSVRMFAVGTQGKAPDRRPIPYRDKVVA